MILYRHLSENTALTSNWNNGLSIFVFINLMHESSNVSKHAPYKMTEVKHICFPMYSSSCWVLIALNLCNSLIICIFWRTSYSLSKSNVKSSIFRPKYIPSAWTTLAALWSHISTTRYFSSFISVLLDVTYSFVNIYINSGCSPVNFIKSSDSR